MKALIRELIPHAPQHGLYLAPQIPADKLDAAIRDYAPKVQSGEVVALYDATRFNSAKDGALFLDDRFVYQNTDLDPAQEIRYGDIVRVSTKRKMLGGREIELDVNRGRATVTHKLDFSARAGAAEYVGRLLHEAMLVLPEPASERGQEPETDPDAVEAALRAVAAEGKLTREDFDRLMDALG